jgi:phosphoglucomutase
MSLEAILNQAVAEGKLRSDSHQNILSLLAASSQPLYRQSIEELATAGHWTELDDRFYIMLKFGTGGLRGRTIGKLVTSVERGTAEADQRPDHPCVGTNAMNFYNVLRATIGLVTYAKKYREKDGLVGKASVIFAHDTRHFSAEFAQFAAKIASDLGANVYLFDGCRATPEMSYAIRVLRADAGVMLTASHNPAHDNGYKVNFNDGAGIVEPHATGIIAEVNAVKSENYDALPEAERGSITMLGEDMDNAFLTRVQALMLRPELLAEASDLKIVYTALHGTGGVLVPKILRNLGFNFTTVAEQDVQDGRFPTVASPNPENAPTLKMAEDLANEIGADAIIGTDPDCDRMGVGVRNKAGEMVLLTGNQIGALMAWYRTKTMFELGWLNDSNRANAVILKTFVTSGMAEAVASKFGIRCVNTLTGFKWISSKLQTYEEQLGIGDAYRDLTEVETRELRLAKSSFLVFGFEESYGYMGSDFSRDKDGNGAVVMFAELAAFAASRRQTIAELLDDVHSEIGYFLEINKSKVFEGADGAEKIAKLADSYAANPPSEIDGCAVTSVVDFRKDVIHDEEGVRVPKEKMIRVQLADGRSFAVRPSGTEPKIKYYMFAQKLPGTGSAFSADQLAAAKADAANGLKGMWAWIDSDIANRLA